jgi:hypothetical protein
LKNAGRIAKKLEKLASQHFSRKNGNESIMVTSQKSKVFHRPKWPFWKMDIYKCPKSICEK